MGPFTNGGLQNLYATPQARQSGPIAGLPAFPPWSAAAGDAVNWIYVQRLINCDSTALIGNASVGAVDLTVNAFDGSFNPVTLPPPPAGSPLPDTSAILTLTIDNAPVTTQQMTSVAAYTATSYPTQAPQSGTGQCPAYDVGPGGYVIINTTVTDANGHLAEYYIDATWGHGNEATVANPGQRGYRINPLSSPPPAGVCNHGDPDYACKGWVGGSDVAYFPLNPAAAPGMQLPTPPFGPGNPPPDCCYEFRIYYWKRVTNGYGSPGWSAGDFQTISLKFSS
jgi:hypothetical protein